MVQASLDKGADPNYFGAHNTGELRLSGLYCCSLHGLTATAELLLDRGANPDTVTDNGFTPLFTATGAGNLELVRLLLDRGANPDHAYVIDVATATPLYVAANDDNVEVARLLIDGGATVDQVIHANGATVLHIAAQLGHLQFVRLLLDRGANVDTVMRSGATTALQLAKHQGHVEVAQLLVSRGATSSLKEILFLDRVHWELSTPAWVFFLVALGLMSSGIDVLHAPAWKWTFQFLALVLSVALGTWIDVLRWDYWVTRVQLPVWAFLLLVLVAAQGTWTAVRDPLFNWRLQCWSAAMVLA